MGILVCYDNYTYDVINDYHLDFLLESGCISGYDRSGNWIRVDAEHSAAIAPLPSEKDQQHAAELPNKK